ncbi:hypothetical protein F5Y15DRAFT_417754 [Xylariaceae sp. FL0016]|nr:hypothetical protein F5Y15DRAFT_417754 [Xylariaceae sp. FL0016]
MCQYPHCIHETSHPSIPFCLLHQCQHPLCPFPNASPSSSSKYCIHHECAVPACPNLRLALDRTAPTTPGTPSDHLVLAAAMGLHSPSRFLRAATQPLGLYCHSHCCVHLDCNSVAVGATNLCAFHKCSLPACAKGSISPGGLCKGHMPDEEPNEYDPDPSKSYYPEMWW